VTPHCVRMPIPLLMILCLAGCHAGSQNGRAGDSPLTSRDLLVPGPYVSGFRVFTFEDRSRPTMPNGDAEGRSSRVLPTTVWYPAVEGPAASLFGGLDATPAEEGRPFPLILYCHGFMSWRTDGKYLAEHLAGHGYVVACPDFPLTNFFSPGGANVLDVVNQPGDVRFLIDQLLGQHRDPNSPLYGSIDENRIGVVGLSLGGMTASLVSFHPRLLDPRVKLAATLAGPGAMFSKAFYENHDIPLLAVHGQLDAIVDYETNALATLERAGPRARLVSILGGTHVGFADIVWPSGDGHPRTQPSSSFLEGLKKAFSRRTHRRHAR
jgi:predicted dienelactone hydrolase